VLEPLRPLTAAARRHGVLSGAQAAVIVTTLDALPDSMPVAEVDAAEATLVDAAHVAPARSQWGHPTTSYGQLIRVPEAFRLLDQARIAWAVHNSRGRILNHGRTRRLASREQAEALLLRDGGCAFPTCNHPAEWCERHHITARQHGGPTDLDNLVLPCAYHHARFTQQRCQIVTRDRVPWFIPPPLIDPHRTPIRNLRGLCAHDLGGNRAGARARLPSTGDLDHPARAGRPTGR
jgi:hypothetical protein